MHNVEIDRRVKRSKGRCPGDVNSGEAGMPKKNCVICYTCLKKVVYTDCSDREPPPKDARCNALMGWLAVSHWQGMHAVEHYDFCSFGCLQKWASSQIPRVPNIFFEALGEE